MILGAEFSAEYGRMRMGVARGVPIEKHFEDLERADSADEQSSEYLTDHINPDD
jgi:hypothetical protein